jgi:hypothetical protein
MIGDLKFAYEAGSAAPDHAEPNQSLRCQMSYVDERESRACCNGISSDL